MLPPETILTFIGAATLLAWVPGPDNIFVLTRSALYGSKVGLFVTLGLCAGLILHSLAVSFGVAAIFETSQLAFDALKIIGAGYLLYLAYNSFRSNPEALNPAGGQVRPMWQMFVRGIVMNVTNPKVAIFFLAFLPQFTAPERGSIVVQMLMLGGIFIVCAIAPFGLISVLAGSLNLWLRGSDRSQIILNRVAGTVFVVLALRLATSHR
jgi:threonine/homoserine/homoserine lactone efflux protein